MEKRAKRKLQSLKKSITLEDIHGTRGLYILNREDDQINLNYALKLSEDKKKKHAFYLNRVNKLQDCRVSHDLNDIPLRHSVESRVAHHRSSIEEPQKVHLSIPGDLLSIDQTINFEKLTQLNRYKSSDQLSQIKRFRLSENINKRQIRMRLSHDKTISDLQGNSHKQNTLKINESKFKSSRWKLFKKKKYVDAEILSVKQLRISINARLMREPIVRRKSNITTFREHQQTICQITKDKGKTSVNSIEASRIEPWNDMND